MRILLIKTKFKVHTYFPPLGLGYIGGVLENAGHSVNILDLTVENLSDDEFKSYVLKFDPEMIGLTCMITEFSEVIRIASICKEILLTIPVIVGGPLASSIPKHFLRQKCLDVVVIGEGELTFLELVNALKVKGELSADNLKEIKGIAFRNNGEHIINTPRDNILNLDEIPFPARHLMQMKEYITPFENWFHDRTLKATNMISSRGCPYRCIYCDKAVFGTRWRGRSAKNTVDEMQMLSEKYGINAIFFTDDMFDLNKKRVFDICDEIKRRRLNIIWGVESRVNHADKEMYEKMYQSGCRFIAFGIESGNQNILDFIQKNITLDQVANAVNMTKQAGLKAMGFFMIGMLGENIDTIKQTIDFSIKLPLDSGGFSKVVPLPNTKLYDLAENAGFVTEDTFLNSSNFGDGISLTKNMSSDQIDILIEKTYWEFFWSRPARKFPKPVNRLISEQFFLAHRIFNKNFNILLIINRIREKLKLPLP